MKKPWSVTTTVRNPYRLKAFLFELQKLEGKTWSKATQVEYQILLIQSRLFGYGSQQFYKNLPKHLVDLVDNPDKELTYNDAKKVFDKKNYVDPPIRGRQSINPLVKLGFAAIVKGEVKITDIGKMLLDDNYDYGETLLRNLIKWQIPNPINRVYPSNGEYDIKPFVGTLHLINSVNEREIARDEKAKGISKKEFCLFACTLVHYRDIDSYADEIIILRGKMSGKSKQEQLKIFGAYENQFAIKFLELKDGSKPSEAQVKKLLQNLKDYGDNAIRYFRMTRYFYIRGQGFYIDLEPRREIEISSLLSAYDSKSENYESKESYLQAVADTTYLNFPWENKKMLTKLISELQSEIANYVKRLNEASVEIADVKTMSINEMKSCVETLRENLRRLQQRDLYVNAQSITQLNKCIDDLEKIYDSDDKPVALEKLSAFGLRALNDAIDIRPNYPIGDDNEPTFTAPAGVPDIECFYENFNAVCEVTMLTGRGQWFNEGQPVMRHLRDFEDKYEKDSFCLFIAPSIHRDTVNTFWSAVANEYEGRPQRIIPITISQYILILQILLKLKQKGLSLGHTDISNLYDNIVCSARSCSSKEWLEEIPTIIGSWEERLLN